MREPFAKNVRAHIFVTGRVHGVFFRENTRERANSFGITGWIKNIDDDQVEAVLEGNREKVENIIQWAGKGPMLARVTKIDVRWEEYKGEYNNFEVINN